MRIPNTIEAATEALTGIESLLTKKEWERAAIIAAFVRLGGKHQRGENSETRVFSCEDFAAKNIIGLTHHDTVRTYVKNWLDSHDNTYPEPGAEIELPTGPYPPGGPRGNTQDELIQSAARKGTLVEKLTEDQKVKVAATIIREATSLPTLNMRQKIEDAADVSPMFTRDETREVTRSVKEHEANTSPFYVNDDQYVWKALTHLRVQMAERPHLWPRVFDAIKEIEAEYRVDGTVTPFEEPARAEHE